MRIVKQIRITKTAPVRNGIADLGKLAQELQQWNVTIQETIAGNTASGTLVYDDGVIGRLTVVVKEGRIMSVTTAASTGASLTWTAS